ncbi:MAG: hypothetical protein NZ518_05410 [Dehalococcoidia bacterium]|nr:hypothetical protein [Dehalococcoidia bacterium]
MVNIRDDRLGDLMAQATSPAPEWFVVWLESHSRDMTAWNWAVVPVKTLTAAEEMQAVNAPGRAMRQYRRALGRFYGWREMAGKMASLIEIHDAIDAGYERARALAGEMMGRARAAVDDEVLWGLMQERLSLDHAEHRAGILAHWLEVMLRRGRQETAEILRRNIESIRYADAQEAWAEIRRD